MKNGVCQLFLKCAYWVTAFWIRWPDYSAKGHQRPQYYSMTWCISFDISQFSYKRSVFILLRRFETFNICYKMYTGKEVVTKEISTMFIHNIRLFYIFVGLNYSVWFYIHECLKHTSLLFYMYVTLWCRPPTSMTHIWRFEPYLAIIMLQVKGYISFFTSANIGAVTFAHRRLASRHLCQYWFDGVLHNVKLCIFLSNQTILTNHQTKSVNIITDKYKFNPLGICASVY